MKVVFMGTPDFAVNTLQKIIDEKHEVALVVTQPDKPKGRGNNVLFTPVKEVAIANSIEVRQPLKVRDEEFINELKSINPDIIVVVAYGQILPESILNIPKYGCVNVHASLLPKYRGAAPIQWAVINGENETGVTIMYMEKGLDTGDMIEKASLILAEKENYGTLHDKLAELGANLLVDTLVKIENNDVNPVKQNDSDSCYAKMIKKQMGLINWNDQKAVDIERLVRGLNPWPSAYTLLNGKTLKIWEADVMIDVNQGMPGEIIEVCKDSFVVATKEGALKIYEIQLEGKKRMKVFAFLLGFKLEKGLMLGE